MRKTKYLQSRLGLYKSPFDKRDYLVTTLVSDIIDKLPSKIDYTAEMSEVRNQGGEGACAGFAGTAIKEWMEFHDYDRYIDLSERFLYEEAKKISGHKEGTTLKAVAKVLVDKGICEEKFWPYEANKPRQAYSGAYHNALKYKIEPVYVRITNEKELKASLVKFGPLHIGVLVYRNWYRQKNGHIPDANWCERIQGYLGGHAIALVGYDDETKLYKFKNSWGTGWGQNGYGFLSYKEMRRTLMDAIQMIDIDDPEEFKNTIILRVANLTLRKRRKLRKKGLV